MNGAPITPPFNGLTATPDPIASDEFILNFAGYDNALNYIVKGTVQGAPTPNSPPTPASTFEFVDFEISGIRIRVRSVSASPPQDQGFMTEITQIGGAS